MHDPVRSDRRTDGQKSEDAISGPIRSDPIGWMDGQIATANLHNVSVVQEMHNPIRFNDIVIYHTSNDNKQQRQ